MHTIPCSCSDALSKLLVKMWSINVAVFSVTLVGFVIRGKTLWEYDISKTIDVGLCDSHLKRSIFRSPIWKIVFFFSLSIIFNISVIRSLHWIYQQMHQAFYRLDQLQYWKVFERYVDLCRWKWTPFQSQSNQHHAWWLKKFHALYTKNTTPTNIY